METKRTLLGHQLQAEILAQWGSRANVEGAAEAGDLDAKDALFHLRLFDEKPARLQETITITDTYDG